MPAVAVDTHAIVWYLMGDPRISRIAEFALDLATTNGDLIYVPSVCLVELTYLVEKGRVSGTARDTAGSSNR
jgi:predicted nucleic-acid-binding protein